MDRVIRLSILFILLISLSESITAAARIRVLEMTVCRAFFGRETSEDDCKIPAVQKDLASLRAWLGFLEASPSPQRTTHIERPSH
jgi:hypothetical protein